jgi:hypothetical protein
MAVHSDPHYTGEPVAVRREPMETGHLRSKRRDFDDGIDMAIPRGLNFMRDRVRWGPVLAGFLTALTSLVILNLLGLAVGLTTVNAGTAAIQGAPPPDLGRNAAIWGAISGIISFLLGGYVAGRTAAVFDRGWGALNGALVFLVGVPITFWLAGQGLGAVLGTLGNLAPSLTTDPGATQAAANQAQQTAQNVTPFDVAQAAERARNAAWSALVAVILGLGAGALGGWLGTRREVELHTRTGDVTD